MVSRVESGPLPRWTALSRSGISHRVDEASGSKTLTKGASAGGGGGPVDAAQRVAGRVGPRAEGAHAFGAQRLVQRAIVALDPPARQMICSGRTARGG